MKTQTQNIAEAGPAQAAGHMPANTDSGALKLPNVCRHLLARPDLLGDAMYRKQVETAIKADESDWQLERCGRSWEQLELATFLDVVRPVALRLKHETVKQYEAFIEINEAAHDVWGGEIADADPRLPEWEERLTAKISDWRKLSESVPDMAAELATLRRQHDGDAQIIRQLDGQIETLRREREQLREALQACIDADLPNSNREHSLAAIEKARAALQPKA